MVGGAVAEIVGDEFRGGATDHEDTSGTGHRDTSDDGAAFVLTWSELGSHGGFTGAGKEEARPVEDIGLGHRDVGGRRFDQKREHGAERTSARFLRDGGHAVLGGGREGGQQGGGENQNEARGIDLASGGRVVAIGKGAEVGVAGLARVVVGEQANTFAAAVGSAELAGLAQWREGFAVDAKAREPALGSGVDPGRHTEEGGSGVQQVGVEDAGALSGVRGAIFLRRAEWLTHLGPVSL